MDPVELATRLLDQLHVLRQRRVQSRRTAPLDGLEFRAFSGIIYLSGRSPIDDRII